MAPRFAKRVKADVAGDGVEHSFRSAGELRLAQRLQEAGVRWEYETESLPYVVEHKYVVDFVIPDLGLRVEYKGWTPGWADGSDRKKLLTIRRLNPDLDLRIVFDNERFAHAPIRKGSRTRNMDWADKNGFQWAVGSVPEEWLAPPQRIDT